MYQPAQESSGLWDAWAGTWEMFAEVRGFQYCVEWPSSSLRRVALSRHRGGCLERRQSPDPTLCFQRLCGSFVPPPSRGTGLPLNRLVTAFGCQGQVDRPHGHVRLSSHLSCSKYLM